MKDWKRFMRTLIWSILMALQIVLSVIYYNHLALDLYANVGWIVLMVSGAVFGWLPIFTLRKKGGVAKGKSYVHTTVIVDTGIYAVVRHPQYLAGMFINVALILISQHWLVTIIGIIAVILNYLDMMGADQDLIKKFGDDYRRYVQKVPRMNFVVGVLRLLQHKSTEGANQK